MEKSRTQQGLDILRANPQRSAHSVAKELGIHATALTRARNKQERRAARDRDAEARRYE